MRGVRADPQPKADTMSLRPVSVPVLVGEQHEPARRWTASPGLASPGMRLRGVGPPDDPGTEALT